MKEFGPWGGVIFFVFQILQVVIFFIPGEVIQSCWGIYIWCLRRNFTFIFWHSSCISNIILHMSKVWKEASTKVWSKDMYDKLEKILNSPKFKLILVILFFLPRWG